MEDRVMLFTDARPNVGATDIHSFPGMVRYYSAAGVGTSVFGVGLDMGEAMADAIARTRGGNYHYLSDTGAIQQISEEEFDGDDTPFPLGGRVRGGA